VRDLGTSLQSLHVIWLNRCGLKDLDGIHALPHLSELYLAYNDIDDISALNALDRLQILDLEANRIDDLAQLLFLQDLDHLDTLTLADNECVVEAGDNYVGDVREYLPQLKYLDDELVEEAIDAHQHSSTANSSTPQRPSSSTGRKYTPPSSKLDKDEIEMLKNTIKYTRVDEEESLLVAPRVVVATNYFLTPNERDRLMRQRPSSAAPTMGPKRSGTALQISASSFQNRPQSARPKNKPARPLTSFGIRSSTGSASAGNARSTSSLSMRKGGSHRADSHENIDDSSSELTYGSNEVFAGNIVKNLRSRKAKRLSQQVQTPPVAPSDTSFDLYDFNGDMLEEVMAYKLEEARKQSLLDEQQEDVETRFMSNDFQQIDTSQIPLVNDDDYFPLPPQEEQAFSTDDSASEDTTTVRREKRSSRSRSRSKSRRERGDAILDQAAQDKSRRKHRSSTTYSEEGGAISSRNSSAKKSRSRRPRPKHVTQKSSSPSENIPPNHRTEIPFAAAKETPMAHSRRLSASRSQLRSIFEEKERMRKELKERNLS